MASATVIGTRIVSLIISLLLTSVTALIAIRTAPSLLKRLIIPVFALNAAAALIQLVLGLKDVSTEGLNWWWVVADLLEEIASVVWVILNMERFGVFNRAQLINFPEWMQRTTQIVTALFVAACGISSIVGNAAPSMTPFTNPALYFQLISLAWCLIVDAAICSVSLYLILRIRRTLEEALDLTHQPALRAFVIASLIASLLIGTVGIAACAIVSDPPNDPGLIGAVAAVVLRVYYVSGLGFLYGVVAIIQPPQSMSLQKPAGASYNKFGDSDDTISSTFDEPIEPTRREANEWPWNLADNLSVHASANRISPPPLAA
ncbi:hypothetical protein SmJEL517_g05737 [Synchytrium microbalum]|uniref:Transmembrane protein n=1 Tax=Synchytrium microbalum TaxID=1806994 RepID=A0A507BJJ9_9FUNG|nr:uncharacterized protein SmJEL517_g05737 [Synchytrium microbalum]TPX30760.1 hypothetical protein SmJEL517_g05737 [Synchytrium microbalum]